MHAACQSACVRVTHTQFCDAAGAQPRPDMQPQQLPLTSCTSLGGSSPRSSDSKASWPHRSLLDESHSLPRSLQPSQGASSR